MKLINKQLSLKQLSIPILIELFLRYLSILINTFMVAKHSNFLVGAMGAGNQILDIFITIFSFLAVGCSVVISQAIGAREQSLAKKAIAQSLSLNAFLGAIFAILIFIFGDFLLNLLSVPASLFSQSKIYLQMLGICLFFDALGIILAGIIRVYNLPYHIMAITLIMDLITLLGNFLVLNFTDWELFGVGLSTIFGRIVALFLLFALLFWKLKIKLNLLECVKFELLVLRKILSIGGFSAGENLLWIVQYTIAFSFVARLGEVPLSAQTIYFQISLFIMLVGQALSVANEIIVGKLVGARHEDIAYKHAWSALYFSALAALIVSICNFIASSQIMNLLGLIDELKAVMLPLFMLSMLLEPARALNIVLVNSLRASGDAKFPFLMGIIFMWGVSLPLGFALCFWANLGILGVWLGFLADELLRGICNALRWKSKKWQGKAVVQRN